MSAQPEPVLDLGSLNPERPFIRIDGESYRFRVDMDLDLAHLAKIERARERIGDLYDDAAKAGRTKANPEQAAEVDELLAEAVRLVMYDEIPESALAALAPAQRLAVVDSFTKATSRAASHNNLQARVAANQAAR